MKAPYFTKENIEQEALEMKETLRQHNYLRSYSLKPEKSALMILDMQRFFLDRSSHAHIPSVQAIIPGIKKLITIFRQLEQPVIFTRHLNTPENAGTMGGWWSDLITEENPLSRLSGEFDEIGVEPLRKSQYDAFLGTSLEAELKELGISQLVIGGVMTHLCCETTARSAFTRGLEVFFLVDGTATYTREHHCATLLNLSHGFAHPVLVREIAATMENKRDDGNEPETE